MYIFVNMIILTRDYEIPNTNILGHLKMSPTSVISWAFIHNSMDTPVEAIHQGAIWFGGYSFVTRAQQ